MIDPSGMSATKFEDEEGNELYETQDGVDEVVVVDNNKVEEFNQEVGQMENNILTNPQEEKQTTVNLASKYMKEGQAVTYTTDEQGNIRNLSVGAAPEYNVYQVGVRATAAAGTGVTVSGGVTWDSKGNVGLYGSAGLAVGYDMTGGIEFVNNTSNSSDFNITDLNGGSADFNGGVLMFDHSSGGNMNRDHIFTGTGNSYRSNSGGISLSPNLAGGTRTYETMGVISLKRK